MTRTSGKSTTRRTLAALTLTATALLTSAVPAHADSGSVTVVWRAANGAILGVEEVAIINVEGCQALTAPTGAASSDVTNATEFAIDSWSTSSCGGTQTTVQALAINQQVHYSVLSFNMP